MSIINLHFMIVNNARQYPVIINSILTAFIVTAGMHAIMVVKGRYHFTVVKQLPVFVFPCPKCPGKHKRSDIVPIYSGNHNFTSHSANFMANVLKQLAKGVPQVLARTYTGTR